MKHIVKMFMLLVKNVGGACKCPSCLLKMLASSQKMFAVLVKKCLLYLWGKMSS